MIKRKKQLIIAVILLIAIGSFAVVQYVETALQRISVRFVGLSPILNNENITIIIGLEVSNPSFITCKTTDLPFNVWLAGQHLGKGKVATPFQLRPMSVLSLESRIHVNYKDIPSIVVNVIKQQIEEGSLSYKIKGTITINALFSNITVPFDHEGKYYPIFGVDQYSLLQISDRNKTKY